MRVSSPHCASSKLGSRMRARCLLLQVNGDSDANACSYGETSRSAIRGGPWIATVADFPQSALYVSFMQSASHVSVIDRMAHGQACHDADPLIEHGMKLACACRQWLMQDH